MTLLQNVMLWFSTIAAALWLIAGGWVKIRDYFKAKAQKKADAIEAEVQARLKVAQATAADAPASTATSTDGPVVTGTATA